MIIVLSSSFVMEKLFNLLPRLDAHTCLKFGISTAKLLGRVGKDCCASGF